LPPTESTLSIIDVGHGNCAVLVDTNGVVVIDTGPGTALLEFLEQEGIERIDVVLISHADQDHIKGLVALIASQKYEVDVIRINSDALKESKLWDDLLFTLNKAFFEGAVQFNTSLTVADSGGFDRGEVHIEILAPDLYIAGRGPGSTDRDGRPLTSNSISAVIRLVKGQTPIAVLTGDLDEVGLDNLISNNLNCTAPVLVFPHHGGKPGSADMATFTKKLVDLIQPQTVIFSLRRGGNNNPQPEIVRTVRENLPDVRIACTQLSKRCAAALPTNQPIHLAAKYAQGRQSNRCCAGTFVINLSEAARPLLPVMQAHADFISANAETALCQTPLNAGHP
jgi:competence protein ComEC